MVRNKYFSKIYVNGITEINLLSIYHYFYYIRLKKIFLVYELFDIQNFRVHT